MSEHTATPWRNTCFQVYGADNSKIAHTGMGQLPPYRSTESEANAAFIVKAVNSHDELVKALEAAEAAYEALMGRIGYREYQALEDTATKLRREALAKASTS